MKLNRLQRGMQDIIDRVTTSTVGAKKQLDSLDSKFGIYDKVGAGGANVMEAAKSLYVDAMEGYEKNVVVGGRNSD